MKIVIDFRAGADPEAVEAIAADIRTLCHGRWLPKGAAAVSVSERDDALVLGAVLRVMNEFWLLERCRDAHRFVIDGSVYDVTDDEATAIEEWWAERVADLGDRSDT